MSVLMIRMLVLAAVLSLSAREQEMAVPAEIQYPLLLKIMTLDRGLAMHRADELVIGVVYQPQVRTSWRAKDAFIAAAEGSSLRHVRQRAVRCVPVPVDDADDLEARAEALGVDVLYVAPLRALDVGRIAGTARARRLRTLTGVPDYVVDGLAVGIGLDGRRPEILINRRAAEAEGADFNVQLLRLARLVNP